MREIGIKFWRNDGVDNWSVQINGLRHEHVCVQEMEDLVEAAMIVAERSLLAEQHRGAPNGSEVTEAQSAIEHQLENWIKRVSEANNELATALNRIKHSFELLLSGEKITDATEVLVQVEGALNSANMAKDAA